MTSYRLAVLSDLHIDSEVAPASWRLAQRAFRAATDEGVDHFVIAGDVFDCATAMLRDSDLVERHLKKKGIWNRDRLTILPGNHDIFHTAHHGSLLQRGVELARGAAARAQQNYDFFTDWTSELVAASDRLSGAEVLPFSKTVAHVTITAFDTTEATTDKSSNARVLERDAASIERANRPRGRHVLAVHNAPFEGRATVADSLKGYAGGYSKQALRRLERLARAASVEVVLCGHVHATETYSWELVDGVPVYLVGRTGGVHDTTPTLGILEVPERGRLKWREVEF